MDECRIFIDEAVTGRSNRRQGLKDLQTALEADEVDDVYILATNRLYRKMYRSLQFVEEEIVERGKRCVFVSSHIDTANKDDWLQRLQLHAMMDEYAGTVNTAHIRAAHVGQLEKGEIFGSLPYGYTGEDVEGRTTKRGLPTRRIVVDPETAQWVRRVFAWYVNEGMSISGIVRRLQAEHAPLSPHAQSGRWTYHTVRRILANPRYVGCWSYGIDENRWLNRKGYSRKFRRDEPLHTKRVEEWRIVDDITWRKTQTRLANNHRAGGRKPKNGCREDRPHLLDGLVYCSVHGRPLTVTGTCGKYVACPICKAEPSASLYSMFNRQLGTELICKKIVEILLNDLTLVDQAIDICRTCMETADRPDPAEVEDLQRRERRLSKQIAYVLDMPVETDQDRAENMAKVQTLRSERATVQQSIVEFEEALRRPTDVPDRARVRKQLDQFAEVLQLATSSGEPGPLHAAREFLTKVTGGRIELTQRGERRAQRGWLRATFQLRLLKPILEESGCCCKPAPYELVTIDIRKPSRAELLAPEARTLYNRGLKEKEVASRLKVNRNTVRKALDVSFAAEGKARPDGRARRWHVSEDQQPQYKFREIMDKVMTLYNDSIPIKEIATKVGADRNTVTAAIRHWHERRGLTAPDGRARRKQLREERDRRERDGDDHQEHGKKAAAGA